MKPDRKLSFDFRMRWWLLLLLCGLTFRCLAQESSQIEGVVFDKDTKERIARTNIINNTTGKSFYNNLKGEFKINAKPGDQLIFMRQDYFTDTLTVHSNDNLVVSLRRVAIPLKEVTIHDSLATPQQKLLATQKAFRKIYGSSAYSDLLSTSPGSGAGISIDAIWNSISRSGRNAQHLQGVIQQDYEQSVIDYRFNRTYVGSITKLKDKELTDFMIRYRPGYYTVTTATDYEFITYIRNNLRRYLRNKKLYSQPPLTAKKSRQPD